MPALVLDEGSPEMFAINEVSFLRRSHLNMTHITYYLAGEVIARVPCDGLLAATPVGSTGYNLSVGGPILSWGVRAFVVSLVAAHALSARGLVASPSDVLEVVNEGPEPLDIVFDGMRLRELEVGGRSEVRFRPDVVGLAQLPGESFYRRFREKLHAAGAVVMAKDERPCIRLEGPEHRLLSAVRSRSGKHLIVTVFRGNDWDSAQQVELTPDQLGELRRFIEDTTPN